MPEYFSLVCLNCGGKLQIQNDKLHFRCPYCGTHHLVRPDSGIVMLSEISSSLKGMQDGMNLAASELAIRRLKEEVKDLSQGKTVAEIKSTLWADWEKNGSHKLVKKAIQKLIFHERPHYQLSTWRKFLGLGIPDEEIRSRFFNDLSVQNIEDLLRSIDLERASGNFTNSSILQVEMEFSDLKKLITKIGEMEFHESVVSDPQKKHAQDPIKSE